MDPIEEKKWLIQRIDAVFQLQMDLISQDKAQFQVLKQKEVDRYDQLGKSVIGATAFVISVLLGLSSIGTQINLLINIGWVIVAGLWIYLIILIFKVKNERIFNNIENSSQDSNAMIYYVMGYFHKNSMNLEKFTPKDYDKFYIFFVYYIIPTLDLGEYQSIKKIINSRFSSMFFSIPSKKQLIERLQSRASSLDKAAAEYAIEKDQYESDAFMEPLLRFGDYLIRYNMGNEVIFSTK